VTSPPDSTAGGERRCANCGTPLSGRYCSACGQGEHSLRVPLPRLLHDFLSDQFQLDARIWRTLRLLLFHPGRLTRQYMAGQRQRFIPPVRLYLFVSIVFFLVAGFLPARMAPVTLSPGGGAAPAAGGTASPAATGPSAPAASATAIGQAVQRALGPTTSRHAPATAATAGRAGRWLVMQGRSAAAHPRQFLRRFWSNLPKVLFFLIPVFALLLKLLYLLRKRYYSEHLVFALHYHSVVFLNLLAVVLLAMGARAAPAIAATALRWVAGVVGAWTALYLFPALRTAYADTWPRTVWRGSALMVLYVIALVWGTIGAVIVTLAMT